MNTDQDCSQVCCVKHRPKIYLTGVSGLGSSLCDHLESQLTALNRTGSSRNGEFLLPSEQHARGQAPASLVCSGTPDCPHWLGDTSSAPLGVTPAYTQGPALYQ